MTIWTGSSRTSALAACSRKLLANQHRALRRPRGCVGVVDAAYRDVRTGRKAGRPGRPPRTGKENVHAQIDDDAVIMSGERQQEVNQNESGRYLNERAYGSFYRVIPLPEGVDVDKARRPHSATVSCESRCHRRSARADGRWKFRTLARPRNNRPAARPKRAGARNESSGLTVEASRFQLVSVDGGERIMPIALPAHGPRRRKDARAGKRLL